MARALSKALLNKALTWLQAEAAASGPDVAQIADKAIAKVLREGLSANGTVYRRYTVPNVTTVMKKVGLEAHIDIIIEMAHGGLVIPEAELRPKAGWSPAVLPGSAGGNPPEVGLSGIEPDDDGVLG